MSSNVTWLSHPLSPKTPAYGGGEGMHVESITQIAAGDTANSWRFVLPNHIGTHIDAPRHFFDSGSHLMDYPADFWIFNEPLLIDVPGEDGYLISIRDLEAVLTPKTELLLLRTGYEAFRGNSRYWEHNPGLAPETCVWIRSRFPNIRVVGMDVISITSRHHREKGREAHRALLDPKAYGNPVLPVEDMALEHVNKELLHVIISPLRVVNADAGPCTVFGYLENQ